MRQKLAFEPNRRHRKMEAVKNGEITGFGVRVCYWSPSLGFWMRAKSHGAKFGSGASTNESFR
jgi:hypothetical protein